MQRTQNNKNQCRGTLLDDLHYFILRLIIKLSLIKQYSIDGEGNGNPLQYSCLENPVDRGAWWAAVHGVTQSWTRLKRLSSSSSNILYVILFILLSASSNQNISFMFHLLTATHYPIYNPFPPTKYKVIFHLLTNLSNAQNRKNQALS